MEWDPAWSLIIRFFSLYSKNASLWVPVPQQLLITFFLTTTRSQFVLNPQTYPLASTGRVHLALFYIFIFFSFFSILFCIIYFFTDNICHEFARKNDRNFTFSNF